MNGKAANPVSSIAVYVAIGKAVEGKQLPTCANSVMSHCVLYHALSYTILIQIQNDTYKLVQ